MPRLIASWNPERDVWESPEMDLFSGLSAVWSETWPPSGTWADGQAFERPTWAPPMAGSACSSPPGLLGTPTSRDWKDGAPVDGVEPNGLLGRQVWALLPTPEAKLSNSGPDYARMGRASSDGDDLTTAVHRFLLPTPTAQASKHAADDRGPGTLDDANLWSVAARLGAPTPPPSGDGNRSSDVPPPPLRS